MIHSLYKGFTFYNCQIYNMRNSFKSNSKNLYLRLISDYHKREAKFIFTLDFWLSWKEKYVLFFVATRFHYVLNIESSGCCHKVCSVKSIIKKKIHLCLKISSYVGKKIMIGKSRTREVCMYSNCQLLIGL